MKLLKFYILIIFSTFMFLVINCTVGEKHEVSETSQFFNAANINTVVNSIKEEKTIIDGKEISEYKVYKDIHLENVWNFTRGSNEVMVGVIDTGIDGKHPDLVNNINTKLSKSFFRLRNDSLVDIYEHGTAVAGVIAANGKATGVAKNVQVVSLKVSDDGFYKPSDIADAINYANKKGIRILNYSAGHFEDCKAIRKAIQNYEGLFICSAGNLGLDIDQTMYYPSSYNFDNIITVGAIDDNDLGKVSYFPTDKSNYGENTVDIYAPGANIYTTFPSKSRRNGYGTSLSTPIVSAVAALLLSVNPNLTTAELKDAILNSVDTIPMNISDNLTHNIRKLDASKALEYVFNNYSYYEKIKVKEEFVNNDISKENNYYFSNNLLYELEKTNESDYDIIITSKNPIKVTLYDENLNELDLPFEILMGNRRIEFTYKTYQKIKYLRVQFTNELDTGNVRINIRKDRKVQTIINYLPIGFKEQQFKND